MLYVFQYRPVVVTLAILSLICLVVVPLPAQNILVMPGIDLLRALQFGPRPIPPGLEYPRLRPPLHMPVVLDVSRTPRLDLAFHPEASVRERNCAKYTELVKVDEKQQIREAWHEVFGFDVWYPYYKEKELEGWVREKLQVTILKLKGEAQFSTKGFIYTLKSKF